MLTDVFYGIDVHAGRHHVLLWYILVGPESHRFRGQWYDRPSKTRRHGDEDIGVVGVSGARRGRLSSWCVLRHLMCFRNLDFDILNEHDQ